MKRIFLSIFLGLALGLQCFAQSGKLSRKQREEAWRQERMEKRAAEKRLEEQQDSAAYQQAVQALKEGAWVIEADNVMFSNGVMRFVTASTNYIAANHGNGTVQTAFDNFNYSGPNGLGGVTLTGNVWGVRMNSDKDGNVYYSYSIQGAGISAVVYVTLTGGSNQASAVINPNFSGRSMTMNGFLYPYDQASVFEGTPY